MNNIELIRIIICALFGSTLGALAQEDNKKKRIIMCLIEFVLFFAYGITIRFQTL